MWGLHKNGLSHALTHSPTPTMQPAAFNTVELIIIIMPPEERGHVAALHSSHRGVGSRGTRQGQPLPSFEDLTAVHVHISLAIYS